MGLTGLLNRSLQLQETEKPERQEPEKLKIAQRTLKKFETLMQLEKISKADMAILTAKETTLFYLFLTQEYKDKKDIELDLFTQKTDDIIGANTRNAIHENNHTSINNAIVNSYKQNGRMPSKSEIARITGISRNTVIKHLKTFDSNEELKERVKEYQLIKISVMDSIIQAAVNGNMQAAKLYMGNIDKLPGKQNTTIINQQNNYIQLNGKIQYLQDLPEERLKQIEEIIKLPLGVKNE